MPMYAGIERGGGVAHDAGQGLEASLLGPLARGDHQGRGGVVDAGGVAGGDGAVLLEGRLELGQALQRGLGAGCSSVSKRMGSPFLWGIATGTISSLNLPAADGRAGPALALAARTASCISRVMP